MNAPRPSPFSAHLPRELSRPNRPAEWFVRRQRRRVLRAVAVGLALLIAAGGTTYLASPRRVRLADLLPHRARAAPPVKATAVAEQTGTVDLQIERGRRSSSYRFRKVGEDWVIQDVTPKPPPGSRRAWLRPRSKASERPVPGS
jgi:hypothetical protein